MRICGKTSEPSQVKCGVDQQTQAPSRNPLAIIENISLLVIKVSLFMVRPPVSDLLL